MSDTALKTSVQDALNAQLQMELVSAYAYLAACAYFERSNLPGFAHWMRLQSREELGHAMKIFDFINDRGGRVELKAIEQPLADFPSPLAVMEQALQHERRVTASINRLYDLAVKEADYPTQVLMQWFVTEQVEEEKSASLIVEQLKLIGDDGTGLLLLDRRLGERTEEE
jgi:ferritin